MPSVFETMTPEERRERARSAGVVAGRNRSVRALEDHIRRVVDSFPPPTPEQMRRLRDLFPPTPADEGRRAA